MQNAGILLVLPGLEVNRCRGPGKQGQLSHTHSFPKVLDTGLISLHVHAEGPISERLADIDSETGPEGEGALGGEPQVALVLLSLGAVAQGLCCMHPFSEMKFQHNFRCYGTLMVVLSV